MPTLTIHPHPATIPQDPAVRKVKPALSFNHPNDFQESLTTWLNGNWQLTTGNRQLPLAVFPRHYERDPSITSRDHGGSPPRPRMARQGHGARARHSPKQGFAMVVRQPPAAAGPGQGHAPRDGGGADPDHGRRRRRSRPRTDVTAGRATLSFPGPSPRSPQCTSAHGPSRPAFCLPGNWQLTTDNSHQPRRRAMAARQTHYLEIAGSIPAGDILRSDGAAGRFMHGAARRPFSPATGNYPLATFREVPCPQRPKSRC